MLLTETQDTVEPVVPDISINWSALFNTVVDWVLSTGVKIIISLIVMFISFKIINHISKKIARRGELPKHDKTIAKTLAYLIKITGKCIVVVCLIGYLGIDTSAITALIASLGVCLGLAVNGAVSNIAGGILIIITRPFKVDDMIEAQGYTGVVQDIRLTNTRIFTGDNKVVYIPNGALANGNIVNYTENDLRRVDFTFSISYSNDFEKAKAIINDIFAKHELAIKDKAPTVRVSAHNASSIDIVARVWAKSSDYWTVYFDVLEAVKTEFDNNGIEIPFNQLDVHVKND
jgi:small conductance mechanosensitive channel